jgi:hypothetical protein
LWVGMCMYICMYVDLNGYHKGPMFWFLNILYKHCRESPKIVIIKLTPRFESITGSTDVNLFASNDCVIFLLKDFRFFWVQNRVARFFLIQTYQNGKSIPKWPQTIPKGHN